MQFFSKNIIELGNLNASVFASVPADCRCRRAFCTQCCQRMCSVLQLVHATIPLAENMEKNIQSINNLNTNLFLLPIMTKKLSSHSLFCIIVFLPYCSVLQVAAPAQCVIAAFAPVRWCRVLAVPRASCAVALHGLFARLILVRLTHSRLMAPIHIHEASAKGDSILKS